MVRKPIMAVWLILGFMACHTGFHYIHATYERLYGVGVDDHVLFRQNVAGRVADIQYGADDTYTLKLKIDKGFANALTEHSQFHIIDDPQRDGRKAVEIRLVQQGGKLLANGAKVQGTNPPEMLVDRLKKDLEAGFGFVLSQIERLNRDVQKIPDSDAYKELKRSMEALAADILRAEREVRERAKKKWLPEIERQMDALREYLRRLNREDELKPLEEKVKKIREI